MTDRQSAVDLEALLEHEGEREEEEGAHGKGSGTQRGTMGFLQWLVYLVQRLFVFRTEVPLRRDVRPYLPKHLQENGACGGIILFDGVCNLCDGTMQFVAKRDPGWFAYGQIQSNAATPLLEAAGLTEGEAMQRFTYIDLDRRVYTRGSTAALDIAYNMRAPYPLLYAFIVVPEVVRDAVYDFVARNRYRWLGKSDQCHRPSEQMRRRFIG